MSYGLLAAIVASVWLPLLMVAGRLDERGQFEWDWDDEFSMFVKVAFIVVPPIWIVYLIAAAWCR